MDIETLREFLGWCIVINFGVMTYWSIMFIVCPGWIYRMHKKWFPISRETFDIAIYSFLGLFKILVIVFNVVPYIALLIIE